MREKTNDRRWLQLLAGQNGEGEWAVVIVLAVIGLSVYGGVTLFDRVGAQDAPKMISADGQPYLACRGKVSIDSDGGGLLSSADIFKVSFIDAVGLAHTLRGVHKIEITDLPKLVDAPMPSNPGFLDRDGKAPVEGNVYTWSDGAKARYSNGVWVAVKVPNDACAVK